MPANEEQMPELIADYACVTGENPLWCSREGKLFWTDIPTGRMFSYEAATNRHAQIYQGRSVGGFTLEAAGGLLLFRDRGNVCLWRDGKFTDVISEIPAERNSRFNDVISDPAGRVFCGTMSTETSKGRLYRLDCDGSIHTVLENIGCSNGMGFSPDLKEFYHTDSLAGEIYCFAYDVESGRLGERRVFATVPSSEGLPDGLTVDANGDVWSAMWDGGCIVRFDATGKIVKKIALPARKVASLTFGGESADELYVTTAGADTDSEYASAGALFRIRMGVAGKLEFHSRVHSGVVPI